MWYMQKMTPESPDNFYISDDESNHRRLVTSIDAKNKTSNQMIVENISGNYYSGLTLSILPGTNTIIIGDNVKARKELIHDLANPKTSGGGGNIRLPKNARVEYVSPSTTDVFDPELSLKDFFLAARGIAGLEEKITELWEEAATDSDKIAEAGDLQTQFEEAGGWESEREINFLLDGLNVAANAHDVIDLETKLGYMSSGQISKAIIARALFSRAGIIVMDDPSVHLDVNSKQWLSEYIKQSDQATIIATSDMDFAAQIADRVVEILDIKLVLNIGTGLENYQAEREKLLEFWLDEANRKKQDIDNLAIQIRDFFRPAAKKTDNMAQVLRAQVSKLERMQAEYDAMPGKILHESRQKQQRHRVFKAKNKSGNDVFSATNLDILYVNDSPDRESTIIEVPKLNIYRGDRIAVIGNNGSGKSTLMRTMAGNIEDITIEGELKLGASVEVGYYSMYSELPNDAMPLRLILGRYVQDPIGIMTFWGFDKSEHYNTAPAELTQRDEIARAQLALLMARQPNLLLLDEPTSYLTPSYQEKLLIAISDYDGTLLVISHDPLFLSKAGLNGRVIMPGAVRQDINYS